MIQSNKSRPQERRVWTGLSPQQKPRGKPQQGWHQYYMIDMLQTLLEPREQKYLYEHSLYRYKSAIIKQLKWFVAKGFVEVTLNDRMRDGRLRRKVNMTRYFTTSSKGRIFLNLLHD